MVHFKLVYSVLSMNSLYLKYIESLSGVSQVIALNPVKDSDFFLVLAL